MKPLNFPEANVMLGEDQPEYVTLPVFYDRSTPQREMTFCIELDEKERAEFIATGKLWLTQLTFGQAFQPIRLATTKPDFPQQPYEPSVN